MFSGCRGLELCTYHGHRFPGEHWCSGGTVIRLIVGSYEHCDNCLDGSRCPVSTGDCSLSLQDSTWRSLVEECDGRTGCSFEADRDWSFTTCLSRGKTDYMKIEYDCVDPSSSSSSSSLSSPAAAVTRETYTSGWSNTNSDEQGMSSDGQHSPVSGSVLISIIVIAGHLSHCLQLQA